MSNRNFIEERHQDILDHLKKNMRGSVKELAKIYDVTESTIRRDLIELEQRGLLYRAHGGAIRREQPSVWRTVQLQDRKNLNVEEKTKIAQFVTSLVHDGESLMLDDGSTTLLIASKLVEKKNLLIVTNAPSIGELILDKSDNKVILTGGELMKETRSLIGNSAEHSLKQYRVDKAIVGASGVIVEEGIFTGIPQAAEIKRIMSANANETILVVDSSKIGSRAFCFCFDFSKVSKLVTDKNISKEALHQLQEAGVEVFIV